MHNYKSNIQFYPRQIHFDEEYTVIVSDVGRGIPSGLSVHLSIF